MGTRVSSSFQLGLKFLGAWTTSTPTPKTVENFVQTQSPLSFLLLLLVKPFFLFFSFLIFGFPSF